MNENANQPNGQRRWNFTTLQVKKTIETKGYGEEQAAALLWLHDYGWNNKKSLGDVAKDLRYDKTTLMRILRGEYGANIDKFVNGILELKRTVESRTVVGFPFVMTSRAERIFDLCEMAFTFQDIVFLYGRSHSGKSEPLKAFALSKPFGRVIYIEMPVGGYISEFKMVIAKALGISGRYNTRQLTELILRAIDPDMILIVDELTRCLMLGRKQRTDTIDFIRYIRDQRKCGVVLCATEIARKQIEEGPNSAFFEQLVNRSVGTFTVERDPSPADLALFAKAINLQPATGDALAVQNAVITTKSLGKWIKVLRAAMRMASKKNETFEWSHVIRTYRWLQQQEEQK